MTKTQLKVHEVRFFDPKPKSIQGLDYEPASSRLAVVRCYLDSEEGFPAAYFLEIWNLKETPCLEFKIELSHEWRRSVEAVCWRSSRVLYVANMDGQVLMIDVESGRVLKTASAVSGAVWCLGLNPTRTQLAAGTENGYISLFNVESDDLMEFEAFLEPKGSRVLSLCWHPSKPMLVSSGRGKIWLWDMEKRVVRQEMRPAKHGKDETIVSSVLLLKDGTIVSGDSTGATVFWDSLTGTPLTTFNSHRSGVLTLTYTELPEGLCVYASGIDSLISEMRLIKNEDGSSSWLKSTARHYHTHDVRALCSAGKYLVSGGQDSYLCLFSAPPKLLIKIPPNTDASTVSTANSYLSPHIPLLLCQNSSRLELWQLAPVSDKLEPIAFQFPKLTQLLRFTFAKGNEIISASALSPNAEWMVVSGPRGARAYRIVLSKDPQSHPDINIIPARLLKGALVNPVDHFAFASDGTLFVADSQSVYSCTAEWHNDQGQQSATVEKSHDICLISQDERIRMLQVSGNGRFVALVTSKNKVQIYDCKSPFENMTVDEDEESQQSALFKVLSPPQSSSIVTSLAITSQKNPQVLLAYANGTVAVFGVQTLRYVIIKGVNSSSGIGPFCHCSVNGTLAVFHNWMEGVVLEWNGQNWISKKQLAFDEPLINCVFTPNGQLANVVQTRSMLQNQLPPALARKVFGV